MKNIIILFTIMTLSACATHRELGNAAYQKHKYNVALTHYLKCANQGDAVCMNNAGYILEVHGHLDKAIQWYTLAARHGSVYARGNLKAMAMPVPEADLLNTKAASRQAVQQESAATAALGLLNAAIQGYNRSQNRRIHCDSIMIGEGMIDTECR